MSFVHKSNTRSSFDPKWRVRCGAKNSPGQYDLVCAFKWKNVTCPKCKEFHFRETVSKKIASQFFRGNTPEYRMLLGAIGAALNAAMEYATKTKLSNKRNQKQL